MGCRVTVTLEEGVPVSVSGNSCKRGEMYAKQECVEPLRTVTAVLRVASSRVPLSVRTAGPVPKAKIADVMRELSGLRITAPVRMGQVILSDVCGTGVDVIATADVGTDN